MWDLGAPSALILLPLPLLLARFLPPLRYDSGALRVPEAIAARLKAGQQSPSANMGRILVLWLIWIGLVGALADPRLALTARALPASGRDIILALDLSGSMMQQDFVLDGKPARRIDALKRVAKEFIRRRGGDRIGLVVFASETYVVSAPSFDLNAVSETLEGLNIGLVGRSTAIGEGLGLALKRLRNSDAPTRLVVLLSDGKDNASRAYPVAVSQLAKSLGIRVDTIALGLHDLENPEDDPDPVDAATLKAVAEESGGTAFRVHSTEELEEVSRSIDQLEGGASKAPPSVIRQDLWIYPALLAFFAVLIVLILDWRHR